MKKQYYNVVFKCSGKISSPAVKIIHGENHSTYTIGPYLGRKEAWEMFRRWRDAHGLWVHSDDFTIERIKEGIIS